MTPGLGSKQRADLMIAVGLDRLGGQVPGVNSVKQQVDLFSLTVWAGCVCVACWMLSSLSAMFGTLPRDLIGLKTCLLSFLLTQVTHCIFLQTCAFWTILF